MKRISSIIITAMIIISLMYSFQTVLENDIYGTLIRLSVIPVILIPNILEKIFKIKISSFSKFIYILFIFLAHFLGSVIDLYYKISWYDTFTHTLFGFVGSFFILEFLVRSGHFDNKKIGFNILFVISAIALLAGLWEIFEFTCDNLFLKDAQNVLTTGVTDTMKDIIVAYIGSIFFSLLYAYEYMYNKKLIIKNFINNIKC